MSATTDLLAFLASLFTPTRPASTIPGIEPTPYPGSGLFDLPLFRLPHYTWPLGHLSTHPKYNESSPTDLVTRNGATLTPQAMAGLDCAIAKAGHIVIIGSFRTYAQQEALFKAKPGLAAPPGKSLHELGLAIDVVPTPTIRSALDSCDWHQFNSTLEPWHFSYGITG